MSGWWVTVMFTAPVSTAAAVVFSEELFRAWLWLVAVQVGRVDEAFMPPFVAVVFPSGRQVRLWQIRVRSSEE